MLHTDSQSHQAWFTVASIVRGLEIEAYQEVQRLCTNIVIGISIKMCSVSAFCDSSTTAETKYALLVLAEAFIVKVDDSLCLLHVIATILQCISAQQGQHTDHTH